MNSNACNIRELVTDILISIDKKEEHSHILLKNVLDKYDYLVKADKNFIKRAVTGTLEQRVKIDYIINYFSKTPVNKMKPFIRNLIRMSVYQIIFMDKIPDSAVCNEAVKLAGKRGFKGLQGFVNGLLRAIIRGYEEVVKLIESDDFLAEDPIEAICIKYSAPELLVKSLISDYGTDNTKDNLLCALNNRTINVRIDETLSDTDIKKIKDEWDDAGINYKKSSLLDYAFVLKNADKIGRLSSFNEGMYTIMDVSSMMVAELAGIKAGDHILDVCAAPGGKSLHAANKLKLAEMNKDITPGLVLSRDVSDFKINLIEENIKRLKISNVDTEVFDATEYDESLCEWADVVIADVPCSGFGVIGRKPDIKYNITEDGLKELVVLQRKILDNAMKYVKSGGRLMFSTCTMRKCENDGNTSYILNTGDFTLETEKQFFISEETDGFYVAAFTKK